MQIRRPDRVLAALLLTVLGASLFLLAQPSGVASAADRYDIRASLRYGCAQNDSENSFVEVALTALKPEELDDGELVLQVGLAGPESPDSPDVFPEGGPSLVTLGDETTTVRLAGPVHDDDHVFIRQLGQSKVITLPLQDSCHRIKPINYGLAEPALRIDAPSCTVGGQANLKVTLQNPNDVDKRLEKVGITQIDYTLLLVRKDGLLAEPVGTLMSFDEPSVSKATLSEVVTRPADYQVRVIGLDGAVVTSGDIRLSCAGSGGPVSSTPPRPSPTISTSVPPSTPPPSSQPASSSPASSSPAHSPSATPSEQPSSTPPSRSTPTSSPVVSSSAVIRPPVSSSATVPSRVSSSSASSPVSSSPAGRPSAQTSSSSAAGQHSSSARPSATPSPSESIVRLVEPRAHYDGLPGFQKDVAMVVLVFAAAMAALVGATVVSARRR